MSATDPIPDPPEPHLATAVAPSVSLHCFWASDDSAQALTRILQDRRFDSVRGKVDDGGIGHAIARYRSGPPPDVILLEHGDDFDGFLVDLETLSGCCQSPTEVVVIGNHDDVATYRRLRHLGVEDYLLTPLEGDDLLETLIDLFPSGSRRRARFVSFIGARGGVGASILAQSVASTISGDLEKPVTLVDFDLPFGTAALNLDVEDGPDALTDAASASERIDGLLLDRLAVTPAPRFELLCNRPESLDTALDLESLTESLLPALKAHRELVLFDLPCDWAPWLQRTLAQSDEIFLVVSPDLISLRNAKMLIRAITALRPNDPAPRLVLNKANARHASVLSAAQFKTALHCDIFATIDSDPKAFGTAVNEGRPLQSVGMRSATRAALTSMGRLACGFRSDAPPAASGIASALRRLVGK